MAYCVGKFDADPELGVPVNPPFCVNIQSESWPLALVSYSMALVTTAVATAMICWKTWYVLSTCASHRQHNTDRHAQDLPSHHRVLSPLCAQNESCGEDHGDSDRVWSALLSVFCAYRIRVRLAHPFLTLPRQLSAVVDDTRNVSNLEYSTPQLQFSSLIWTYMTSHILVRPSSHHHVRIVFN